jgi:hypothetical protein
MNTKYSDLANIAHNIFMIMPYRVGAEASISLCRDVIGWRLSNTMGEIHREEVVVRQFAMYNLGLLASHTVQIYSSILDNDFEVKKEAEKRKLHRMANISKVNRVVPEAPGPSRGCGG